MGVRNAGGSKGGIWVYSGVTQESMEDMNVGTRGSSMQGPGRDHEVWGAEEVWEGPPRPRLPCAVTHLGLLSTSTSFHFRKQKRPGPRDGPLLSANHGRPCLPSRRCGPAPQSVPRALCANEVGTGSSMFCNCPMGLWAVASLRRRSAPMSVRGGRST